MLQRVLKDRILLSLLILILLLKLFSLNEKIVEQYYTSGVYQVISRGLRFLFGWIPFSIGDVLYTCSIAWVVWEVVKLVVLLIKRQARPYFTLTAFLKYLRLGLFVYSIFTLFWGLNYYRRGISSQLGLTVKEYSKEQLINITCQLQEKLNRYAALEDSISRLKLNDNEFLFAKARQTFLLTAGQFPYLRYSQPSLKPSLFGEMGDYLGYTGYYNPFTGEAQVKTTVPVFLKPFIICHEIGHQLGYAKENEANFVSFLACRASGDIDFLYSVYFDMYRYALNDLMHKDLFRAIAISRSVHPRVKNDIRELQRYFLKTKNAIEPLSNKFYDQYLKLNNQPKGFQTYNEVVAWMIAFREKFGTQAL